MISSTTKNKGFTVLETLIYAAGVALLIGVIVSALVYSYRWYDSAVAPSRADQIGASMSERINSALRSAISYEPTQSFLNRDVGSISVNTKTSSTTTMNKRFILNGGRLMYTDSAGTSQFISPQNVSITKFYVTIATTTVSTGVRFTIDIMSKTRNGTSTDTYSNFVMFRNSYQ